jgi:predicted ATPase
VRERLARRVGAHASVVASYAPGFAELLDSSAAHESSTGANDGMAELPNFEFEEGFARHAVAVADAIRCVGSQERPLVILLDNLQFADRGSIAVLRRLLIEDRGHHTMIVASLCGQAPAGLADTSDSDNQWGNWNPQRDPQLLLRRIVLEPFEVSELERLLIAGLPGPVERPHELADAPGGRALDTRQAQAGWDQPAPSVR